EPVRFGAGVLRHLLRHGKDYDVVHTASFPYFSMLAAGAARRRGGYRLIGDWHELWSAGYWATYVGGPQAVVARKIQQACARIPHTAFAFSRLHAERLVAEGHKGTPRVIWEEWADDATDLATTHPRAPAAPDDAEHPQVVFAGRLIAEKQAPRAVEAIAQASTQIPNLTGVIFGDGPEAQLVQETIDATGTRQTITAPGFVDAGVLHDAMRGALCLLAPSRREGYGLIVVEAAALGVPIIVALGPDNAATELVDDGVNGFVCQTDSAEELAQAIVRVHQAGPALRRSTLQWHDRHLQRVKEQDPLQRILDAYAGG
ncbi:MAG: glycosyl transferase group 1, partial [Solirubrobacterales bacterium]|nr:glycosyl transferase group 1 [Solirubrobacterales bacterium]